MTPLVLITTIFAGLVMGSFLNVVIHRLPRGESVVKPRSYCPGCKRGIPWYENIPVASFILLRGKCGSCGVKIPWRYPAVELSGLALALYSVYRFGVGVDVVFIYFFLMALLAVTLIDWEHRIIPDEISLSFILLGIIWSLVNPGLTLLASLSGALAGGGGLWLVGAVYKHFRHTDGMGGGDVKLMGMIGAFLGIGLVLPVIVIASFFGSVYGIILLRSGKEGRTAVAFGSFLAPAAAFCLFFGSRLLACYYVQF
ncbi:MAG: prepilin peptidase [Candidatus Krumholzibacteriota bacterium]|nr:prepilin peptidase [Candidatus Krumholzibacteriota bacterium]